jgi:hypothetical protein
MPRQKSELTLARQSKRAGLRGEEYVRTRVKVLRDQAARDGWRASELAMCIADVHEAAERVYGRSMLAIAMEGV